METRKGVVTIAVEMKNGHTFKEVIIEIKKNMTKYGVAPVDIKKVDNGHIFAGLEFDSGTKAVFNLIFLEPDTSVVYFPNIKGYLEQIKSEMYDLLAIREGFNYFSEYQKNPL